MTCHHPSLFISGVWREHGPFGKEQFIMQDCPVCGSTLSFALKWDDGTDAQRQQAHLADLALRPNSPEMMG